MRLSACRFAGGTWPVAIALALLPCLAAHARETRSFVLSNFYTANYYGDDTCPGGLNPLPDVFFKRDLKRLGLPQAQVDAMFDKDYNIQNGPTSTRWVSVVATRGNGKDNVYIHPETVPDARLMPAVGRFGYGFDLDGRGAIDSDSYEDPETHQQGVDNQLFRAIGCIQVYKGAATPRPPLEPEYRWGFARPLMGAWLVQVSGEDLSRDGDVTVTFANSIDAVTTQDATAHLQRDMTYRMAARPSSYNVLRGRMRNGVITTEPSTIRMECDPYIQPLYEFLQARLRLKLKPDGNLEGTLGGYQPWYPLYWSHAKVGYIDERGFGLDSPALYHALRRYADAYPDPRTGANTAISAAYRLEGVPAFVTRLDAAAPSRRVAVSRPPAAAPLTRAVSTLWRTEPQSPGLPLTSRRLRPEQYRRVIADVFGPNVNVTGRFEPDVRESGLFAIGTGRVGVTSAGMEQYDAIARSIAAQVVSPERRGTLVPCVPKSADAPDPDCATRFFNRVGPLLYRRPLAPADLAQWVGIAGVAAQSLGDFYSGLEMSLAGLLVSPQFLFRYEAVEADPSRPGARRLDAYSRASQLSFFLWNAGPDQRLLAAARDGMLDTEAGMAAEAERMLRSPRVEAGVRAFFADMLQLDRLETLGKDATIYPKWTVKTGKDAREQTLRTIVDVLLVQDGDYRDLFTTRRTFLTPLLGSIYRVPVAQTREPWQPFEFAADDAHAGIQTQASFVALHSHEGLSSPTLRGKALQEILLCAPVPAPPANVNFAIAQDTHNAQYKTMRERLTVHRTNPTCAGCHKRMDPAGLALENFASDGGYRTTENGQPLDTSGELNGIQFSDAAGLGRALHDSPAAAACLVRRMYSYATGNSAARRDMPWIRSLEQDFVADGYRIRALMRRIAASPNLYRIATPAPVTLAARDALLQTDGLRGKGKE
jgi:hypothetical protein